MPVLGKIILACGATAGRFLWFPLAFLRAPAYFRGNFRKGDFCRGSKFPVEFLEILGKANVDVIAVRRRARRDLLLANLLQAEDDLQRPMRQAGFCENLQAREQSGVGRGEYLAESCVRGGMSASGVACENGMKRER